jgi:Na+/H+ antiporter NhaD/arsenite permease-like protein
LLKGLLVFAVTYVLIAGRRLRWLPLDRPAGALAGAVMAVMVGVLTPAEALASINGQTLVLLFGLMGVGTFLTEGALVDRASAALLARVRTPARLLGALVWGAGALAAFVTNDAVCVLGAPVVVSWIRRHRLPPLPFLLALATAANTGSVATLVGNPQNMLCGTLGGLGYRSYLLHVAPVALLGLALNHALLARLFRAPLAAASLELQPGEREPVLDRRAWFTLTVVVLTVAAYLAGTDLAWTAVAGFTALLIVHRADASTIWARIDWSVLLFFAGLFVAVQALVKSGGAAFALQHVPIWSGSGVVAWVRAAGLFLVGSNVVSNVPFILVIEREMAHLPDPQLGWELLAMASTFAGNLTLLGSVANIIVAERGREVGGLPFLAYLRVGLPLAILTSGLGTLWLLGVHGVLW